MHAKRRRRKQQKEVYGLWPQPSIVRLQRRAEEAAKRLKHCNNNVSKLVGGNRRLKLTIESGFSRLVAPCLIRPIRNSFEGLRLLLRLFLLSVTKEKHSLKTHVVTISEG